MSTQFADWDASLKEIYSEGHKKSLAYVDNFLLGTMPKERSGGKYFVQNVHRRAPGGGSASWVKAKANGTKSLMSELNITRVAMYQRVGVGMDLLLSGDKSEEAIVKVSDEFDLGFKELASKVERRLFRSVSGRIGRYAATVAEPVTGNVLRLTDKADVWNFQQGDLLNVSATDGTGTVRAGGSLSGILTVASVDEQSGTVTTAGTNMSSEVGLVDGDFIFQDGDYASCIAGLESWLPAGSGRTAALAASFYGLTRSIDSARLGGVYIDGNAVSGDINDILVKLLGEMSKYGAKPDVVVLATDAFTDLQRIWIDRKQPFQDVSVSASDRTADGKPLIISKIYPGIKAIIGGYKLTIVPARGCPSNRMYVLESSTWKVRYVGTAVPMFLMEQFEGGEMLRFDSTQTAGPEVECYLAAYCNLGCEAPGRNGVAQLPTS